MRPPADPLYKPVKDRVPMGNAVALNVGGGGPGKGYVQHKTGSQGQHGPAVAGSSPGPDLMRGGGPGGFGFKGGK